MPIQVSSFQILLAQRATGFNPTDHCQCFCNSTFIWY